MIFRNRMVGRISAGLLMLALALSMSGCNQANQSEFNKIPDADPSGVVVELEGADIGEGERTECFNFCKKYFVEGIPSFSEGERPDFSQMKWYAAALHKDQLVEQEDGARVAVPGEVLEQTAALFGVSYGMKAKDTVTLEATSGIVPSTSELLWYRVTPLKGGGRRVAMKVKNHFFQEFMNNDAPEDYEFEYDPEATYNKTTLAVYEEMKKTSGRLLSRTYYEAARDLIVTGRTEAFEEGGSISHVVLYVKPDGTLGQILAKYTAGYEGGGKYYYPPDFKIPE